MHSNEPKLKRIMAFLKIFRGAVSGGSNNKTINSKNDCLTKTTSSRGMRY